MDLCGALPGLPLPHRGLRGLPSVHEPCGRRTRVRHPPLPGHVWGLPREHTRWVIDADWLCSLSLSAMFYMLMTSNQRWGEG